MKGSAINQEYYVSSINLLISHIELNAGRCLTTTEQSGEQAEKFHADFIKMISKSLNTIISQHSSFLGNEKFHSIAQLIKDVCVIKNNHSKSHEERVDLILSALKAFPHLKTNPASLDIFILFLHEINNELKLALKSSVINTNLNANMNASNSNTKSAFVIQKIAPDSLENEIAEIKTTEINKTIQSSNQKILEKLIIANELTEKMIRSQTTNDLVSLGRTDGKAESSPMIQATNSPVHVNVSSIKQTLWHSAPNNKTTEKINGIIDNAVGNATDTAYEAIGLIKNLWSWRGGF